MLHSRETKSPHEPPGSLLGGRGLELSVVGGGLLNQRVWRKGSLGSEKVCILFSGHEKAAYRMLGQS